MSTSEVPVATPTAVNGAADQNAPPPLLPSAPLPLIELCAEISKRLEAFIAERNVSSRLQKVQDQTRIALDVIREAFKKYSLSEIALAYNGGKDCLVLLVLYLAALHGHPDLSDSPPPIQSVYIVSKHPFKEVDDFVARTSSICSLTLWRCAKGMKDAFTDYLKEHPKVQAIFVGTRRTDPHGADLTHFDRTDHGWPDFMRIHPVIDWQYVDIWTFIRYLNVPYCSLYDMGYTSLGGTTDTHRNPALRRTASGSGTPKFEFRPAYELIEDDEERLGRDWERRGAPDNVAQTPAEEKPPQGDLQLE